MPETLTASEAPAETPKKRMGRPPGKKPAENGQSECCNNEEMARMRNEMLRDGFAQDAFKALIDECAKRGALYTSVEIIGTQAYKFADAALRARKTVYRATTASQGMTVVDSPLNDGPTEPLTPEQTSRILAPLTEVP